MLFSPAKRGETERGREMAEVIIGPLLVRLQELALSEARKLVAVNDDIRRLRDKLMWLQAFLREADARRHVFSNDFTRVWLEQTRDAVFDAEDAIDRYNLQLDMSRYPEWARSSMGHIATFTTQLCMRHSLSRKVEKINLRLEDIIQNKDKYKMDDLNKKTEVSWKASTSIHCTGKLDYSQQPRLLMMHGKERKKLVEALREGKLHKEDQNHNLAVISVIGKSGVGKTTLVRDIYEETKRSFGVHVMESFAPYLTATSIIQQIVQKLTPDNDNCAKNKVHEMLKKELEKKKYLLVIDGEVSSTEWNNILDYLRGVDGAIGSRIVHIAQNKPEEIYSSYHHVLIRLLPLQQDSTIDLFRKWLSHTEASDQESQEKFLEEKKETIYRITGGLPLAVVLLSGLVKTKEFNADEWITVLNYLDNKKSKRLECVLSVCFDDLPHELKCCFLYFAALPANTTIEAHILVCMWMAEGFLRTSSGLAKRMEKVGYIYLDELIYRNLVKLVHMDADGSKIVTIQNKVHEFLQFEAQEASFVKVQHGDDIPTLTSARRLSLQNYKDKYAALANPLPKLRSVFSHFGQEEEPQKEDPKEYKINYQCCTPQHRAIAKKKKKIIKSLLHGSKFLRVINLRGIEIGEKLPDEICNVVHLQYLGITSCSLNEIPKSIRRLTSLQTLDVRETSVRDLPQDFWMIKTLRHVFGFALKLPSRIGSLKHLQTLNSISVNHEDLVLTLGEMINLRHLVVWNISEQNVVDFSAALERLENLRSLTLNGEIIPPSVLTSPSNRHVKFMVLHGELKLSSELNGKALCLPNLVMLSLERTNICEEFISKLEAGLPSLETLVLNSGPSSAEFRCVQMLKIDRCGSIDKNRERDYENDGLVGWMTKTFLVSRQI